MERRFEMAGGGVLRLEQNGPRVRLEAERPADGRGLYKAWLTGQSGGRYLLGTLVPEGERLIVRRTVSLGELERARCWPLAGAEAPLAFPFRAPERWYCEQAPARLVKDPVLRGQLRGPMLCCRQPDGFCLAAPLRPECPVALNGLFCFARAQKIDGKFYLVWAFDGAGEPVLPDT